MTVENETTKRTRKNNLHPLYPDLDFSVFPLLQLPKVFLLEVAETLVQEDRRDLSQSCSTFRQLLHDRKAKHLDCRTPVLVTCMLYVENEALIFDFRLTKRRAHWFWTKQCSTAGTAPTLLPSDVVDTIRTITTKLCAEEFLVHLSNTLCTARFNGIVGLLLEELKEHPCEIISVGSSEFPWEGNHFRQLAVVLMNCSRSISLRLFLLTRAHILKDPDVQSRRDNLEREMRFEAERRGFGFVVDFSGPETKCFVQLEVIEDVKKLMYRG